MIERVDKVEYQLASIRSGQKEEAQKVGFYTILILKGQILQEVNKEIDTLFHLKKLKA